MSPWGWRPARSEGIWRHGPNGFKPLVAAAPYLSVLVLLAMLAVIGGTLTSAKGVLFDLPERGLAEGEPTKLVALVMPLHHETLVFFDDARYVLGDAVSVAALSQHLADRLSRANRRTLLVLADRRVAGGELMEFAGLARRGGAERILFAEKRAEKTE